MAITNFINENEENLKSALREGISNDAVESTLDDVINKSDNIGKNPSQIKEVVETIVDMKKEVHNKIDESYASDFVKENNEKISSALKDGISPNEITKTLVEKTNSANDKKSKKHLKFITKLISKMKKKELKLKKGKENISEKGYQKTYTSK